MEYYFTLPFPISVNALYGGGSRQQRFPSKKYKAWTVSCPQLSSLNLNRVKIYYSFYMPDNRARDMDNLIKCVNDYLVKQGVLVDDNWHHVAEMTLTAMGVDKKAPRVDIVIVTCN